MSLKDEGRYFRRLLTENGVAWGSMEHRADLSRSALIRNLSPSQKPSLARSYIQLFGIFDKFRLWQALRYSW